MFENVYRHVLSLANTLRRPREILLSGRLTRYREVYGELSDSLGKILPVRRIKGLKGASISKEAGQGYAMIAEGLANGYFKNLVKHVGIDQARGTVMNWVYHPRLVKARERLLSAYKASLKPSVLEKIL